MSDTLGLRAGELVEVRSEAEILATLGPDGTVDGLPLMPEMLEFCGRRFRVSKRADKTCDIICSYESRRMTNAVHLDDLRCTGAAHGGCQAACFLFWKEAWLKRVDEAHPAAAGSRTPLPAARIMRVDLDRATRRPAPDAEPGEVYVCQATELLRATTRIRWWDPRQYLRELRSGNVRVGLMVRVLLLSWYNVLGRRLRLLGFRRYPYVAGTRTTTPSASLGLQPGDLVRVKPKTEIVETLNKDNRNRGLGFDVEMVPFCGGEFRVRQRVTQIISDRTGKMIVLPNACIMLEGVYCRGHFSQDRLFCPRSIPPYWREIWLERVDDPVPSNDGTKDAEPAGR